MQASRVLARSLLLCTVALLLDQLSKVLILHFFDAGESLPVFPGIFHLTYVQNTGAAFGLLKGQQALFMIFSCAVIIWMIGSLKRSARQGSLDWASALILAGALGNLIDRARMRFVIDFIDLRVWPVFNVADSALTIGVAVLLWRSWKFREPV
jgi:signal peptidase II